MADLNSRYSFTYNIAQSIPAATKYCRVQFPFVGTSVAQFVVLPALLCLAVIILGRDVWVPLTVKLAEAMNLRVSSPADLLGLLGVVLYLLLVRLLAPIRKAFVARKYAEAIPNYTVAMTVKENTIEWAWPGARMEYDIDNIYAIMKVNGGISIGLGTSGVFVPVEVFHDEADLNKFTSHLLSNMNAGAVARSRL